MIIAWSGAAALLIVLALRTGFVMTTVRGNSMLPTLSDGERVLAVRAVRPRHGHVVVFERPDIRGTWLGASLPRTAGPTRIGQRDWMVKRIAAVAGDPLPAQLGWGGDADGRVPPGHVLVLGDNAAASTDSRDFGPVSIDRVLATVVRVARSPGRHRTGERASSPAT